jgi:outer membrane protein OmpA-like peptidoglycan-associated protein
MSIAKTAGAAIMTLALAGCASIETARARLVHAPSKCVDQTVQIYFEPESAEITREGRAVLTAAANGARGCQVNSVDVVGLADAAGAADANLDLSKRRAQSVTAALASAGLPAAEFRVAAVGQTGAVTPAGNAAPLRRRADITLHLAPK